MKKSVSREKRSEKKNLEFKNESFLSDELKKSFPFKLLVINLIVLLILIFIWVLLIVLGYAYIKGPVVKPGEGELGTIGIFGVDPLTGISVPEDCLDSSLKNSWDSIFIESSDGVIINKDPSYSGPGCAAYYMYKTKNNQEAWVLYDVSLQYFFGMRIMMAYYISGNADLIRNVTAGVVNSSNPFNNELFYNSINDRMITNVNGAVSEFSGKFKVSSSGWFYNATTKVYQFNEAINGNNLSRQKIGVIPENKTIDAFFYFTTPITFQISTIPNLTILANSDWRFGFDLDEYFSSSLKLNFTVYNLTERMINFSVDGGNRVSFKPDANFTGKGLFRVMAFNGTNFLESNIFSVDVVNISCSDSDGGEIYGVRGTAINFSSNGTDACYNGTSMLREFLCNGTAVTSYIIYCNPNYYCNDGACIVNISANRTPEFAYSNCNINNFTWNKNNNFSYNISNCFTDPDRDNMAFRFANHDNSHVSILLNGLTLFMVPENNWVGTGDFYVFATDNVNAEVRGNVYFSVRQTSIGNFTNNTNDSLKIINPIPNGSIVTAFIGDNLTFFIANTNYSSIRWYLNGELIRNDSNNIEISRLTAGNHTLEVQIKRGIEVDSKIWRISILDVDKTRKFIFDSGKVMLALILIVGVIIIILIVWLFIQENRRKDKGIQIDLDALNKHKTLGKESETSKGFNIPR